MTRATILQLARLLWLLVLLIPGAEAAEPKRVLIIHSFGRDFAPYNIVATTLRTDLTQLMRESVALHEASLDLERGSTPEDERLFLEYLVRRNLGAPPDLVIAIANPAMLFCLRYRDELFPGRPLLVTGLDRRRLETVKLPATDRAVTVTLDFPAIARTILELRPETDTLALVVGGSQLEQFWGKAIERELAPFGDRLRVLPAGDLNLEQMRQRVAALPPHSAVFYYMFAVGTDGALHEDERALPAIRESSSAPVYGIFNDQLGRGIVGGPLVDSRSMGAVTAKLAARMLKGEPTGDKRRGADARAGADLRLARARALGHSRIAAAARSRGALPAALDLGTAPAADPGRRRHRRCCRPPSLQRCCSSARAAGVPRWRPLA